jgi:hypothetical protein
LAHRVISLRCNSSSDIEGKADLATRISRDQVRARNDWRRGAARSPTRGRYQSVTIKGEAVLLRRAALLSGALAGR